MVTWTERLILWNQYEILKRLDPGDKEEYKIKQEILSNGYEQYYSEINLEIYPKTTDPGVSSEVEDILDLFRCIKFSCRRLGYTPKSKWAEFEGFDANNDGGHYGFAHFVRRTLGKWEELKDRPDNSHSSISLEYYRRMLRTWHRLDRKHELTEAEIEEIAEAF